MNENLICSNDLFCCCSLLAFRSGFEKLFWKQTVLNGIFDFRDFHPILATFIAVSLRNVFRTFMDAVWSIAFGTAQSFHFEHRAKVQKAQYYRPLLDLAAPDAHLTGLRAHQKPKNNRSIFRSRKTFSVRRAFFGSKGFSLKS